MTAPHFIGPFCMSVGAHSSAQSWHTDPHGLVVESVTPMRRVLARYCYCFFINIILIAPRHGASRQIGQEMGLAMMNNWFSHS